MGELTQYLNSLYGCYSELGYIEIRTIVSGVRGARPHFFSSLEAAQAFIQEFNRIGKAGHDLYIGVVPRLAARSTKDAVGPSRALWVDVDTKTASFAEVKHAILRKGLPKPSMIVCSGNGLHAYWLLEEEVIDAELVESVNRGLALALGADHCHNIDRILRPPSTYNHKSVPAKAVYLDEINDLRYRLVDFRHYQESASKIHVPNVVTVADVSDDDLKDRISNFLYMYVKHGLEVDFNNRFGGDRSRCDFYVVNELLRCGLTPEEVMGIFLNPAYKISEKTLSKPRSNRRTYIETSIRNALGSIAEEEEVDAQYSLNV